MKKPTLYIAVILLILRFQCPASGQIGQVLKTLKTDDLKLSTGLTWDGSQLWVIDDTHNLLCKIDPVSGDFVGQIPAPDPSATGLAWDGTHLWCCGNRTNKLYQLNTSGEVLASFGINASPKGLTWVEGYPWYADSGRRLLFKVDPIDGAVLDSMPAPGGSVRGLTWDGHYLWCSDNALNELYRIDLQRKKIILILPSPINNPYGLAWDGKHLWSLDYDTGWIYRIGTTGSEKVIYLDSLQSHIQYKIAAKNVGATQMSLRTWICRPYESIRHKFLSEVTFTPAPDAIATDQYGQRFAYYLDPVNSGDSMIYLMDVDVTTYDMRHFISPDSVGVIDDIPDEIMNTYLKDDVYYDIYNSVIVMAVREAVGNETNMYWKARNIHDYIIEHISYVLDGRWDHAPQVLQQGHGSCSEYSMLFVAMCRSAGIPARYEAGAYFGGSFPYVDQVYHRWNHVYLPPYGWIHVDVTWDDRDNLANQTRYFGAISMRVFPTLISGGGSNVINWGYNSANSQIGGIREQTNQYIWSEYHLSGWQTVPSPDPILIQIYPNPFDRETHINFELDRSSDITLAAYDQEGKFVKRLFSGEKPMGRHTIVWNAEDLPSGIYFIRLSTDDQLYTVKSTLVR